MGFYGGLLRRDRPLLSRLHGRITRRSCRWIKEEEFDLYKDVVKGAYRFHDMMLERLLQLAGPDTTVILCSDHGFESGSQRPRGIPREPAGPAAWHRQYGIFVMAGPGIKRDERIYGASLIDIAPTVLTLFDLPIGEDMDGRPLLEAFEETPKVKTIPSWEEDRGRERHAHWRATTRPGAGQRIDAAICGSRLHRRSGSG